MKQYENSIREQKCVDSSFLRNLGERTDTPAFTIEDAIAQLKDEKTDKSDIDYETDRWFLNHLPTEFMNRDKENVVNAEEPLQLRDDSAVNQIKLSNLKKKMTKVSSYQNPGMFSDIITSYKDDQSMKLDEQNLSEREINAIKKEANNNSDFSKIIRKNSVTKNPVPNTRSSISYNTEMAHNSSQ